jgi:two-component system sensor histidine kinase UhpB
MPEDSRLANNGDRGTRRQVVWIVGTALAYYAGARLGFFLQSPRVPQSVLWLPNSMLLAVLIVSSPLSWPLLLVPALGAQLLVGHETHAPLVPMTLLFVTNCVDAMLGATLWRLASAGAPRVGGLRSLLIFVVVCAAAPTLLVSFADAGITVATHWSNDFWLVFATRARANVLTNLIFVPPALALLSGGAAEFAEQWRSRWLEGSLMLLGLLASSLVAFRPTPSSTFTPALAYLPLVFILWCAVRFGVAMTGASILALTYGITWAVVRGIAVTHHDPSDVTAGLQFALLAIALPVLCLAAVVQDRERASMALADSQNALSQSISKIQTLAGRLLWATERERSRIALELHDDVGQQLAALGIGLSALKRHLPNDERLRNEINALHRQATHVAEDVRLLSHELHPAALRFGRLVPAMRDLCGQFGIGGSMHASFAAQPEELNVSDDVALCVYRVTQEALSNAARHSQAREAYVTLRAAPRMLELRIEDNGAGFDETLMRSFGGLGLTSMEERVRMVGGTVHVESAPGHGTRITLRVPYGGMNGAADASPRR